MASSESPWLDAARAAKRALLGTQTVHLLGQSFRVTAESRGRYDDRDYPVLAALARGRRRIFDIGANLGMTSMIMATAEPATEVVAFEASEKACLLVKRNVGLNGLGDRVQVVEAVLAERSGAPIDFFWDHSSGGASTIDGYLGHTRPLRKISLALDDFLDAEGLDVDLLKIDVEGAEARVLRGARATFERCRPVAILELHSWQGVTLAENAAEIIAWAEGMAYDMVYLRTGERLVDSEPLKNRGRCHVLLVPSGEPLPPALDDVDMSSL